MKDSRKIKILILILFLVEISSLFLTVKSFSNREILKEKIVENKINNKQFSMYVENEEGKYSEYTNSNIFPNGYKINLTKSSCIDTKGNKIDGILSGTSNSVTITSNKTAYCYIYFDIDYVLSQLCKSGDNLGSCLTTNNEEIDSLDDTSYAEMYRYTGTNEIVDDNYICFGTTDKNECINNPDKYMYRIIGVTSEDNTTLGLVKNQLKLIKHISIGTHQWHSDKATDTNWESSTLYTYLQNDVLNNSTYYPSGWINKISSVKWNIGNVKENSNINGNLVYEDEMISVTSLYSKLGLMYLSDYYYAYISGGIINCHDKLCSSWVKSIANESRWTMTYYGDWDNDGSYSAFRISSAGFTNLNYISNSLLVFPVFYLNSEEIYVSGDGTLNHPIMLADKEAPEGNSITINNNATYTTNTNVTLTLSSSGATEMCISESTSCTNWEEYKTSKSMTLSNTLGTKTVYVMYRDEVGNISEQINDTISLYEIVSVPSQNGSLTYTGSSQTAKWSNYDSTKLTIGGTTSSTNAGTFNATFTPKTNYIWSDGTQTSKTVSWSIGKKANTLTLSATSGSVTYGSTKTFTVSTNTSGGTLSVKSSDTSVATVSISGTTVTITSKKVGSATITVTSAATTNYNSASATYTVTVNKASGSLSVSPTSLTINAGKTGTIAVTRAGDGTITATSSNTGVATVSVSGTTVTVTGKMGGTATITVKVAAGTNHKAPSNKTVSVFVSQAFGEYLIAKKTSGWNSTAYSGLYRYSGAWGSVNNWVKLGDATYRIIGVTSAANSTLGLAKNQVKMILYPNAGTHEWHTYNNGTTWENSTMYSYLQGSNVLGNTSIIPSGWSSKISSVKWYIGDLSITPTTGASAFSYEDNAVTSSTSKIGLMYVSDYYYAYVAGGGTNCNAGCVSWMTMWGSSAWTMIRTGDGSYNWIIDGDDWATITSNPYVSSVRPVFYLTTSVKYKSGSGTSGDPFIIE